MKKHSKFNKTIIYLSTAVVLGGCSTESPKPEYAVRVNKSYLTDNQLDSLTNSGTQYKNEIMRSWINKEILYQEAVNEGITGSDEYLEIIENSQKELAASLLLKKYISTLNINTDQKRLEKYYQEHLEEFRLNDNSFPPFDLIKKEVKNRYLLEERTRAIDEYIEKLYSKNDIEIRTGKR